MRALGEQISVTPRNQTHSTILSTSKIGTDETPTALDQCERVRWWLHFVLVEARLINRRDIKAIDHFGDVLVNIQAQQGAQKQ